MNLLINQPSLPPGAVVAEVEKQQKEKEVQPSGVQKATASAADAVFKQLQAPQTDQQAKDKAEEIEADLRLAKAREEIGPFKDIESIFNKYKFTREKDYYEIIKSYFEAGFYVPHSFIKKCLTVHIKSVQGRAQLQELFAFDRSLMNELGIPNEKRLIEIIKIAAAKYPIQVSRDIQLAKIASKQIRIEIAKIAAAAAGLGVSLSIHCYEIDNVDALREIMYICIRQNPRETERIVKNMLACFMKIASVGDGILFKNHSILREDVSKLSSDIDDEMKLFEWLKFYIFLCQAAKLSEAQIKMRLPYAQQIIKLHGPDIRFLLADILVMNEPPPDHATIKNSMRLFHMLLHSLKHALALADEQYEQIAASLSSKVYSDNTKKEIVLSGLLGILYSELLRPQEKADLLKHIFIPSAAISQQKEQKEKADTVSKVLAPHMQLLLLDALISCNSLEKIMIPAEMDEKGSKASDSRLKKVITLINGSDEDFKEYLDLKKIQDFSMKYNKTVRSARNPLALLAYAIKLSSLSENKLLAQNILREFATAILEGTYVQWRYQTPASSHLACVFKGRQKLFEQWKQGEQLSLEELLKSEEAPAVAVPQEFGFHKYLHQCICVDKHLDSNDYPNLVKCLQDPRAREAVIKQLSQKLAGLRQGEKLTPETLPLFRLKLEIALIGLLNPKDSIQAKIGKIGKLPLLKEICVKNQHFIEDLESLQKQLGGISTTLDKATYTIADTDHWEDMLLIGTEVVSCQRIGGMVTHNKCLLGYLADGKNRAIVVKNGQGKIVARCIMRILWDATAEKPVIYQEKLYHNSGVPKKALDAIDKMFIRRAKALNLPLVRTNEVNTQDLPHYPNALHSLLSPSPFEYVDGFFGMISGNYSISSKNIRVVPM